MHDFTNDFYGHHMKVMVLGYIRPELDYVRMLALGGSPRDSVRTHREMTIKASVPFLLPRETYSSPVTRFVMLSGPSRLNNVGYRFGR